MFFAAKEGYVNIIKMLVRADAIVTEMDKVCFVTVKYSNI